MINSISIILNTFAFTVAIIAIFLLNNEKLDLIKKNAILQNKLVVITNELAQCKQDEKVYNLQNEILDVLKEDTNDTEIFDINYSVIKF